MEISPNEARQEASATLMSPCNLFFRSLLELMTIGALIPMWEIGRLQFHPLRLTCATSPTTTDHSIYVGAMNEEFCGSA